MTKNKLHTKLTFFLKLNLVLFFLTTFPKKRIVVNDINNQLLKLNNDGVIDLYMEK